MLRRAEDGRADTERLEFVDELRVGSDRYLAWEEAAEREVVIEGLELAELATPRRFEIEVPAGSEEEPLAEEGGEVVGALVRSWLALEGTVEVGAEPFGEGLFKADGQDLQHHAVGRRGPGEHAAADLRLDAHRLEGGGRRVRLAHGPAGGAGDARRRVRERQDVAGACRERRGSGASCSRPRSSSTITPRSRQRAPATCSTAGRWTSCSL